MTTNMKLINLLLILTNMKNEILLVLLEIILLFSIVPYIMLGLLQITNINIIIVTYVSSFILCVSCIFLYLNDGNNDKQHR